MRWVTVNISKSQILELYESNYTVKNKCLEINKNLYEVLCIDKLWDLIYVCDK